MVLLTDLRDPMELLATGPYMTMRMSFVLVAHYYKY